jgi:Ca2+-binding RTX toxin-like protein
MLALGAAAPALATFQPLLLYDPPKITLKDLPAHISAENTHVYRAAGDLVLESQPAGISLDPESKPGCEPGGSGYLCARQGVERILVTLGELGDQLTVDLGASANKVRLTAKGEAGADSLEGGPGKQVLIGGGEADTLIGGPGPDVLRGGPGSDDCRGGPGDDRLIGCE